MPGKFMFVVLGATTTGEAAASGAKRSSGLPARFAVAAAALALVSIPRSAQAQVYTWGGTGSSSATTDYINQGNWSNTSAGAPPRNAGQAAVFDTSGNTTVNVTAGPIAPDSWTFTAASQNYTVTGGLVNFNGAGPNLVNAGGTNSISNNMTGAGIGVTGGSLTLLGSNTFTTVTVSAGTLKTGNSNALGTSSSVIVGTGGTAATLDLFGNNPSIGSLSGNASGVVTNRGAAAAVLSVGGSGASTIFAGTIQDGISATGLAKYGTGRLTLSGNNTYTGNTTITQGILALSGSGSIAASTLVTVGTGGLAATLDISGTNSGASVAGLAGSNGFGVVTLGSKTLTITNASAANQFYGAINGGGGLTITGGTQVLSDINGYAGSTTVTGGTLALAGIGSIAGSSGVTVGNGSGSATFDISGSSGASIKDLAGANDGTVTLGNHTLTITSASSLFYGAINGSGGLTVAFGDEVLAGTNGYTGVTTINSGAGFGLFGSGSIANSSKVIVDGTLDISNTLSGASIKSLSGANSNGLVGLGSKTLTITAANDTFAGSIGQAGVGETGGLILSGGTEKLTGTSHYIGATTIAGGTLEVDGSIASSSGVTVTSGGSLSGAGTVGNTQINAGGIFAPGSGTLGTMSVAGNLAFQSGAAYLVQVSPSAASSANVTGSATLGGATVNAMFVSGSYVAKQYTILTAASGVNGTFGSLVNSNLPKGFQTSLSYDGSHAYLNLALSFTPPNPTPPGPTPPGPTPPGPTPPDPTPPAPPSPNFGSGLSANQQAVGNALVNFFDSTGGIPLVFGTLTPTGLTQLSGESATGSQQTTFDGMTQFMGVLTDPAIAGRGNPISAGGSPNAFADESNAGRPTSTRDAYAAIYAKAPPASTLEQRWSVWGAALGGSQTTHGNSLTLGSQDTLSRIYGTVVGADYLLSPHTIAGFALMGGGTNFSVNNLGSGRSDLFQAGAFVRHDVGPAYLTGALAYGWQDITTDRNVTVAGLDHLRAEFNANAWSGRLEGGYRVVTQGFGVTPYAAAQFVTFDLPGYREQATVGTNTFALSYNAKSVTDPRSELGVRTDKSFAMQDGIFTLRGRLAWAHDFNTDRSAQATFQTLPGASFVVNGATHASDSALTTASAEWKWINGWSAAATFEGEFSNVTSSYAGKGVVRYAW